MTHCFDFPAVLDVEAVDAAFGAAGEFAGKGAVAAGAEIAGCGIAAELCPAEGPFPLVAPSAEGAVGFKSKNPVRSMWPANVSTSCP